MRVAQLVEQSFQFIGSIGQRLSRAGLVTVLHLAHSRLKEIADLAVLTAGFDRLVHFCEHFLQLLLGEVALLQLVNHLLQRLHCGFRLAFVQLLGEVFAQLRLLHFQLLERLGHRLHLIQIHFGDLQVLEELVDLTVLQRLDGFLQAGQGKPELLGLLGQVGKRLRHLFLLLLARGIVARQTSRGLLQFLQFLLQLVQRVRGRVRIAELLLH